MTSSDDAPRDDSGPPRPELPLDEEAAWLAIVANYGERPVLDDGPTAVAPPAPLSRAEPLPAPTPRRRETADDEHHFVPPEPPPLPRPTPARRLAWTGLFLPPLLLLVAVCAGWTFPMWVSVLLVMSFIGGFGFLVATMPRDRGDGWDDGAVV